MADDFTTVNLPDGNSIRFPSTMSGEDINAAVKKHLGEQMSGGATMSAPKPFMQGVEELARRQYKARGEFGMGLGEPPAGGAATFENYTPEGRAEHPILSRIGDITRGAKEFGKMVGTLAPLIPEGEALRAFKAGTAEAPAAAVATQRLPRPVERIPMVAAEPVPSPPPAVRTAYRVETPGTIENPELLGVKGRGGVVVRPRPLLGPGVPPEAAERIQPIGTPGSPKPTIESVVNQATGAKPLARNVPLREQLRPIRPEIPPAEAPSAIRTEVDNNGIRWAISPEGYRVSVPKSVAAEDVGKFAAPKLAEQAQIHAALPKGPPTEPPTPTAAAQETDPLKIKYPDPAVRKFVRANGPEIVDAVGDDKKLLQEIHDLKNVDVREAAINAGIDMGTKHVGSKGELGPDQMSRQEVIKKILQQGIKPSQIPELARQRARQGE